MKLNIATPPYIEVVINGIINSVPRLDRGSESTNSCNLAQTSFTETCQKKKRKQRVTVCCVQTSDVGWTWTGDRTTSTGCQLRPCCIHHTYDAQPYRSENFITIIIHNTLFWFFPFLS